MATQTVRMDTSQDLRKTDCSSPEAGDGCVTKLTQTVTIPNDLLSGYPMQWALDQVVHITNIQQRLMVSSYKMATGSRAFNAALYLASKQDVKIAGAADNNEKTPVRDRRTLAITYDENHSSLFDILFAVHYSHINNCRIIGIMQLEISERHVLTKDITDSQIYRTNEMLINRFTSYICLKAGFRVAALYGIEGLRTACYEYTKSIIDHENCWQLWTLATFPMGQNGELVTTDTGFSNMVQNYICANFTVLYQERSERMRIRFENLHIAQVEHLLKSSQLNVRHENEVLGSIRKWLEHNTAENTTEASTYASRLIAKCVRIKELEFADLEYIYSLTIFRTARPRNTHNHKSRQLKRCFSIGAGEKRRHDDTKYMTRIRQVRQRLFRTHRNLRPLKQNDQDTKMNDSFKSIPEEPEQRIPHEAIFIFGGWKDSGPCQDVSVLDSRSKKWIHYGPQTVCCSTLNSSSHPIVLPDPLMSFGIVLVQNRYIIIAGGEDSSGTVTSAVIRYDIQDEFHQNLIDDNAWRCLPPLQESRRDLVLVQWKDRYIYAIGGDNNRAVLNTAERLELNDHGMHDDKGWTKRQGMLIARAALAADCLDDKIYVCGGYTESHMEALTNTCEVYCPVTDQWTFIQPMGQPRYYCQAVAVDGMLFVLGGGGESGIRGVTHHVAMTAGYSSTVERYNPKTAIWELMPPMSERADFAACLFENRLVSLGGGGEAFCINDVEQWKPWTGTETGMSDRGETQRTRGPRWLSSSEEIQCNMQSWEKYVNLPYAVWGHRCVVLKGWERILPYIRRNKAGNWTKVDEPKLCDMLARPIMKEDVLLLQVPGSKVETQDEA